MLVLSRKPSERLAFVDLFELEVLCLYHGTADVRLHIPGAPLVDVEIRAGGTFRVGSVIVTANEVRDFNVKFGITAPDAVKVKRTHTLGLAGITSPAGTNVYAGEAVKP